MSFILSVLFYLYLSAIVAAHNKHRKVLPYIGSETKHIYKEGEGFFLLHDHDLSLIHS